MRQPGPPRAGELTLFIWRDGSNRGGMRLRAHLTGPNRRTAVPVMIDAVVIKITESGMVLRGTEIVPRNSSSKANVEHYPQTWWCRLLPGKMDLLPEESPQVPEWRRALDHST